MTENLKPCPFCLDEQVYIIRGGIRNFYVFCPNCCAQGGIAQSPKDAIEKWNTRA